VSDSRAQPQWSPDGQWWWDGEKWLPAASVGTTTPAPQAVDPASSVPSPQQVADERKRAEAETKRLNDDRKQAEAAAKKIADDQKRLADDERKRAEAERKTLESEARKAERQAQLDWRRGKVPNDGSLPMDKLHGRAEKLLAQSLGPGEPVLGRINGISNIECLVLTDQRAVIIKVGWRAGQTLGGKVTSFNYRNITSVEVRTSIVTGTFEISAGGMQGPERSYWTATGPNGAWHAPNTIPISKNQQAAFQRVATFIRERAHVSAQPVAQTAPPPNKYEQLKTLAELKEQGILTDEEFQSEKAKLLSS
jgi:hypothetical protein